MNHSSWPLGAVLVRPDSLRRWADAKASRGLMCWGAVPVGRPGGAARGPTAAGERKTKSGPCADSGVGEWDDQNRGVMCRGGTWLKQGVCSGCPDTGASIFLVSHRHFSRVF